MKLSTLLVMVSVMMLSVSCGDKSGKKRKKEFTPFPQAMIQDIMDNQDISCASISGECPAGVVRVLIASQERSGACSGFMVGPTTMVTNYHCISTSAECAITYVAVHNGDGDYLASKCKRIIKAKQDFPRESDPRRAQDFAVIEIEDVYTGEAFNLSEFTAADNETITAWVFDHTGLDMNPINYYKSRITEFRCKADRDIEHASLILADCPIISGNSGSPALNGVGEIVGVIWGGSANFDTTRNLSDRRRNTEADIGAVTEVIHFDNYVAVP